MLYLIIAPPRTGKSQLAAKLILDAQKQDKPVYTTNYNQTSEQRLKTGTIDFPQPEKWWDEMPTGSIWIIDEAQDLIPQRDKNTPLPEWVKLFSKHGHHDLTIYVITQDAMQLDVHMRRNANMTWYMTRPLNMRKALIYAFRGYQEIPNDAWKRSRVLKTAESKTKFAYKKKYQEVYVSAQAHEHIKIRFPKKLLLLPVLVFVVGYLLVNAFTRLNAMAADKESPVAAPAAAVIGAVAPTAARPAIPAEPSALPAGEETVMTPKQYLEQFQPRIPDLPWSAPAYDGFEITDYPRPSCWVGRRGCKCISQQGSKLDISDVGCRRIVKDGYFDPYKKQNANSGTVASASASPVPLNDVIDPAPVLGVGVSDFSGQQAQYGQMR